MIRLLWRTDEHMSDHTPSSRTDDWTETVFKKLIHVGEIARDRGCDAVLSGGDFFNDKPPPRTSHGLVTRVAQVHKAYPCPTYANVGNHDCRLAKIELLDEGALGTLFGSGVFRRCYDEHEAVFTKNGVKVRVVGIPYRGRSYDVSWFTNIQKGDEDYLIVIAHLLASPTVASMFEQEDVITYASLRDLCPSADVICFGHWHKNQGIMQMPWGTHIVNVGSMTRGSLVQDNLDRIPSVVLIECGQEGVRLEEIPLEVQPAMEVFDLQKRAQEEIMDIDFGLFTKKLEQGLLPTSTQSIEDQIQSLQDLDPEVRARAYAMLERARLDR